MRMQLAFLVALCLLAADLGSPWAQTLTEPQDTKREQRRKGVSFSVELQNLFLMRSDSDFDGSEYSFNEEGQEVGAFATVLKPGFTWHLTKHLRVYYEAELGLSYWSMQDPDQRDPLATDIFMMKHRELWGSGESGDDVGYKIGYGRFKDPTGLFLNHWIGTAQLWVGMDSENRVGIFMGQLPDSTHEGIDVTDNNFVRDIWVYGARWDTVITHGWSGSAAFHALYDSHLSGQERWLIVPSVHVEAGEDDLFLSIDAMLQHGQAEGQTPDGRIQTLLAWAGQSHLRWDITDHFKLWPSRLDLNLLVLSADDAHPDNDMNYAFAASGKNNSATLMLTEDEIRDWYDNYDEGFSSYQGGFFTNRAGLFVADLKATWKVEEDLDVSLVLASANVLKPTNALDNTFLGFEMDLMATARLHDMAWVQLAFGCLIPGAAAGALSNSVDLSATEPVLMGEISVLLKY